MCISEHLIIKRLGISKSKNKVTLVTLFLLLLIPTIREFYNCSLFRRKNGFVTECEKMSTLKIEKKKKKREMKR